MTDFRKTVFSDEYVPTSQGLVLNSLGVGARDDTTSTQMDNTSATTRWGYAVCELNVQYASSPTGRILVWLLPSYDGTNYPDGSDSIEPSVPPAWSIPIRSVTTAQRIVWPFPVELMPAKYKVVIKNDVDVAIDSAGNTFAIKRYGDQSG
jgi:hypothetical protein